jgi:hypothetical protein
MSLLDSFNGAAEAWIASHADAFDKHFKALGKQLSDEFENDKFLEALEPKGVKAANACVRRELRGLVNAAAGYGQGDACVVALVQQHPVIDIAVRTAIFLCTLSMVDAGAEGAKGVSKKARDWVKDILESDAGDTSPYEAFLGYMKTWLEKPTTLKSYDVEEMVEDVVESLEEACYGGWPLLARFD